MEIEILSAKSSKAFGKCTITADLTVSDLRTLIHKQLKSTPEPTRQSLRLAAKGKSLKDTDTVSSLNLRSGDKLYIKDLGPQIGWKTVFLAEYAGPLVVYLMFYARPSLIYGTAADTPLTLTAHIAAGCYTVHYVKRLLETIFVHRFSHCHHAIDEFVQELQLLLGLYRLCCLSCQSSIVHRALHADGYGRIGSICAM